MSFVEVVRRVLRRHSQVFFVGIFFGFVPERGLCSLGASGGKKAKRLSEKARERSQKAEMLFQELHRCLANRGEKLREISLQRAAWTCSSFFLHNKLQNISIFTKCHLHLYRKISNSGFVTYCASCVAFILLWKLMNTQQSLF